MASYLWAAVLWVISAKVNLSMKQHFREPHFFIESAEGNDYFRVTPKVYDNLMGKPKKKPSREQGER